MKSSAIARSTDLQKASGDIYLKFQLPRQIPAVLPMRYIQEAMLLPSRRLTPMPNMPASMLGLMNRRSRVVWVIDLAMLLGLAVFDAVSTQQYMVILIQVGSVPLGLAVHQVEAMVRIDTEAIQSPIGQVSANLMPYLRGCLLQQQPKEVLLVLDAEAIAQSPILQTWNS